MIIFIQRRTVSFDQAEYDAYKEEASQNGVPMELLGGGRQILTLWFPKYMQRSNKQNRK